MIKIMCTICGNITYARKKDFNFSTWKPNFVELTCSNCGKDILLREELVRKLMIKEEQDNKNSNTQIVIETEDISVEYKVINTNKFLY